MKLPRKKDLSGEWIIGDSVWLIKYVKSIQFGNNNKGVLGLTDFSDKSIQIKTNQSKIETLSTFVHEIVHAMDDEYDMNLSHEQVYALEEAIMQFLGANF